MKTELERREIDAGKFRFAIVVSRWHEDLTSRLAAGAATALSEAGVPERSVTVVQVPGAFELPIACLRLAKRGNFDAVIALGVVIRGDTPHFDYVAGQAAAGIMRVSLDTGVPVMFGVITADNLEQAEARAGERSDNKGFEAAWSAIELAASLDEISGGRKIAQDEREVFSNVV